MFRPLAPLVLVCTACLGCAHTSSPPESRGCDDDTECPVGKRCSTGRCVSGDQLIAQQRSAIETTPVQASVPDPEVVEAAVPPDSVAANFVPPPTTKTYSGNVHFGQMIVPLQWTTKMSTVTDPENVALAARIREVIAKVSVDPPGPDRKRLLDELTSLGGQRRLRLRALGEKEASVIMALMVLVDVWKHPEYRMKPPSTTSLVAVFPGTEARGTVYCDKLVNVVDDGGPGVDPLLIQMKSECEGREFESFMIVEAIADGGGVDSSHKCVRIAEAAGGSYRLLLECLKSRKYE